MDSLNETREFPRFVISGDHGSAGKTTVSIGLSRSIRNRGLKIQPFKKGPDFIDPIWATASSGRACRNLDFFMMEDRIVETFARSALDADISFIEGNKGLYDGVDTEGSNSTSAMARLLKSPVVLVVDAGKMTRGVAPLLMGYRQFEPDIRFAGVILNRVAGERHESKLRAAIEHYTDFTVLGSLPRDTGLEITERHLGLIPANEKGDSDRLIESLARYVAEGVDVDKILESARGAPPLRYRIPRDPPVTVRERGLRVAVARDEAFCFYYPENIEALEARGASIIYFSPLKDKKIPESDGLFLGGGFPEQFSGNLAKNRSLLDNIRSLIEKGFPAYAECGGLMYLSRSIRDMDGRVEQMAGVLPFGIQMQPKPKGRGYMVLRTMELANTRTDWVIPSGIEVKAHEFHYSRLENEDDAKDLSYAYDVIRGYGVNGKKDGILKKNLLASYVHLHHYCAQWWADSFMDVMDRQRSVLKI